MRNKKRKYPSNFGFATTATRTPVAARSPALLGLSASANRVRLGMQPRTGRGFPKLGQLRTRPTKAQALRKNAEHVYGCGFRCSVMPAALLPAMAIRPLARLLQGSARSQPMNCWTYHHKQKRASSPTGTVRGMRGSKPSGECHHYAGWIFLPRRRSRR